MATIHAGDYMTGCAECAVRYVGVLIDGSHMRADMLDVAIIRLAESHGWDSRLDVDVLETVIDAYTDSDAPQIAFDASQEAIDWMNDRLPEGYAFSVDESCLRLDRMPEIAFLSGVDGTGRWVVMVGDEIISEHETQSEAEMEAGV